MFSCWRSFRIVVWTVNDNLSAFWPDIGRFFYHSTRCGVAVSDEEAEVKGRRRALQESTAASRQLWWSRRKSWRKTQTEGNCCGWVRFFVANCAASTRGQNYKLFKPLCSINHFYLMFEFSHWLRFQQQQQLRFRVDGFGDECRSVLLKEADNARYD